MKAMIDFIKDADCTKETPVKLGVPDAPIYGKGIKLKPRVDGRTDSEHFKKIYLPELLPLEEYDLIVVLISGGKDSVACYLKLLELGVPKEISLCRKCMTLIFVLVAYRLDLVIGTNYIRDAVIIAFIANETISLVENAGLMGLPLPAVITKAIDILQKKTESEGK